MYISDQTQSDIKLLGKEIAGVETSIDRLTSLRNDLYEARKNCLAEKKEEIVDKTLMATSGADAVLSIKLSTLRASLVVPLEDYNRNAVQDTFKYMSRHRCYMTVGKEASFDIRVGSEYVRLVKSLAKDFDPDSIAEEVQRLADRYDWTIVFGDTDFETAELLGRWETVIAALEPDHAE
jgi:hypothetical protein